MCTGFCPDSEWRGAFTHSRARVSLEDNDLWTCQMLIVWLVVRIKVRKQQWIHQWKRKTTIKILIKKKKHDEKHRRWQQWGILIYFNIQFHFSSLCVSVLSDCGPNCGSQTISKFSGTVSPNGDSDCWSFLCIIVRSLLYNMKHLSQVFWFYTI